MQSVLLALYPTELLTNPCALKTLESGSSLVVSSLSGSKGESAYGAVRTLDGRYRAN